MRRILPMAILAATLSAVMPSSASNAPAGTLQPGVPLGYAWWHRATNAQRDAVLEAALLGIRAGWSWGAPRAQADIAGRLVDDYKAGRVSAAIVSRVGSMRLSEAPSYSRPISAYRVAVNRYYLTVAGAKVQDVGVILLCLADKPVARCKGVARP